MVVQILKGITRMNWDCSQRLDWSWERIEIVAEGLSDHKIVKKCTKEVEMLGRNMSDDQDVKRVWRKVEGNIILMNMVEMGIKLWIYHR
jgi:hypothetical protein